MLIHRDVRQRIRVIQNQIEGQLRSVQKSQSGFVLEIRITMDAIRRVNWDCLNVIQKCQMGSASIEKIWRLRDIWFRLVQMKNLLLFWSVFLWLGCSESEVGNDSDLVEVEIIEIEEIIEAKKYPTLESYYSSIEFQDGKKLTGEANEDVFFDVGGGIRSMNIAEFYNKNKELEIELEAQKVEFSLATLVLGLTRQEASDPLYSFLKNRGVSYSRENGLVSEAPVALIVQAAKNKKLLESLTKKYSKQGKAMNVLELEQLIMLMQENGNYQEANRLWKEVLCAQYPATCSMISLQLDGWVKDDQLEIVSGVQIEILNTPKAKNIRTDKDGEYEFEIEARPYQLIRLRYSASGYMPLIKEIRIGPKNREGYKERIEARLPRAKEIKTLELKKGETQKIETLSETTYEFDSEALLTDSGEVYIGTVQANIFDFDPSVDDMGRVLEGALRAAGGGVAPQESMKSYGMAYVNFNTESGEALRVSKKNPITVIVDVVEKQLFYDDYKIDGQSEDEFWEYWMDRSKKKGGFVGISEGLASYWVYNQQTGIWEEVSMEVIAPGQLRSIFYTHN